MSARKLPPTHPGEVLLEEFLKPLEISQYRLAKDTSVPPAGSMRSCTASVASAQIRLFDWPAILEPRIDSGSTCKLDLILRQ